MLFSFGTLEFIYFAIGFGLAIRFFYNLFNDYRIIRTYLTPKSKNFFRITLFACPLLMVFAWPFFYAIIFIIAILRPDLTDKAVERKKNA